MKLEKLVPFYDIFLGNEQVFELYDTYQLAFFLPSPQEQQYHVEEDENTGWESDPKREQKIFIEAGYHTLTCIFQKNNRMGKKWETREANPHGCAKRLKNTLPFFKIFVNFLFKSFLLFF